jgi:hypothetical protein
MATGTRLFVCGKIPLILGRPVKESTDGQRCSGPHTTRRLIYALATEAYGYGFILIAGVEKQITFIIGSEVTPSIS